MRIMRDDLKCRSEVASYQDITTATAHAFMVNLAQGEAVGIDGQVKVSNGELSGRSEATVWKDGKAVATYCQEW